MMPENDYAPIPWGEHVRSLRWEQGQHIIIAGPNGSGKTTLASDILDKRGYVVGFAVKAKDPTLKKEFPGWSFLERIEDVEPWMNRVMIWPKPKRKETTDVWRRRQQKVFKDAFDVLVKADGWGVFIDELKFMCDPKFGAVGSQIEMMHYISRSADVSCLSLAQRPSYVPLAVLSNASHAYIAKTYLAEDLKRLGNLGGVNVKELSKTVTALPSRFDFVYQPTLAEGTAGVVNVRR